MNFTVTLSDAETKALAYIAASPQEWIENAVKTRCAAAIEEIANAEIQQKLAAGQPVSGTKEQIVLAANIVSAADRAAADNAASLERLAQLNSQGG